LAEKVEAFKESLKCAVVLPTHPAVNSAQDYQSNIALMCVQGSSASNVTGGSSKRKSENYLGILPSLYFLKLSHTVDAVFLCLLFPVNSST
jgi:hypothetical protein